MVSWVLMGKVFGAPSSPEEVEEAGVPVLLVSEDFWVSRVRRYQHGRQKKREGPTRH